MSTVSLTYTAGSFEQAPEQMCKWLERVGNEGVVIDLEQLPVFSYWFSFEGGLFVIPMGEYQSILWHEDSGVRDKIRKLCDTLDTINS